MAEKYYAVKKGKKPGVYKTWPEMNKQIEGYKNPVFKAFPTEQEAWAFVGNLNENDNSNWTIAYTDGSYRSDDHSYSYGAAIFLENGILEMSQRKFDSERADLRNVAGEIDGAAKVMEYAYNHNIKKLEIHHDYQGISAWATGEWKANKELTKKYKDFTNKISKKVELRFVWVKGHSGEAGNELVDKLAGEASKDYQERLVKN
ncbi:ribonuclease H1 domain-containing protein [Mesoplasma lactucae]|uniref:ribonuclease H n=1 Tax=Mesoplasma lactucae ATCC 49193 TaxID=81460 RepID=A0A291ISB6_9MOLU|nr:ribonuclease H family protein [Mesoplasma lactucae]ATG97587.1 RNase H [Mesoplasma lactucae ATCC 49193]ATZ19954.1 ribonuclease H [Mesoplasma lactucae ATCC 49193]MCL8217095.1 Ribonuclease H [Mesoplasma lactucae ATCC 49193]